MSLKKLWESMHGKIIIEVDDDQMIKYKDADGESKEMSAKAAKRMKQDHPAKIEYDKLQGGGNDNNPKSVNIFDEPADSGEKPSDEPDEKDDIDINTFDGVKKHADKVEKALDLLSNDMKKFEDGEPPYNDLSDSEWDETRNKLRDAESKLYAIIRDDPRDNDYEGNRKKGIQNKITKSYKKEVDNISSDAQEYIDKVKVDEPKGDDLQIGGPNGLEVGRDEIKKKLMDDPEIAKILGDEDDVYWDDADLVSSKHDDATIASIDPDSNMTIGDIKKAIRDYREDSNENFSNSESINFKSVKEQWLEENL